MTPCFEAAIDGWSDIDRVRQLVDERLGVELSEALADQVAMAAHELAENGIKYSTDRVARLRLYFGPTEVRVTVESRPDAAELSTLVSELDALAHAPDALAHYKMKMGASAERRDGRAGLGLVRICLEAGMTLTHELQGGLLLLTARRSLP